MKMIFAVDDSDTSLVMASDALEGHFQVMTMPSAAKMFSLLERFTPDLILLDMEMPEMNGLEALKKLKSSELWAKIPVIFITAYTDADIEVKSINSGVADFVSKPFSVPMLLNRINTHLSIDENTRENITRLWRAQNSQDSN